MCEDLIKHCKYKDSILLGEKSVIFVTEEYDRTAAQMGVNKY